MGESGEIIMPGLNLDQTIALTSSRLRNFVFVATYTVVGTIANLVVILLFANGATMAFRVAIAMSVVTVAVLSMLPLRAIFSEIAAAYRDRIPELHGSHLQAEIDAAPFGMWIGLSVLFNVAVAAIQLWALFSA